MYVKVAVRAHVDVLEGSDGERDRETKEVTRGKERWLSGGGR